MLYKISGKLREAIDKLSNKDGKIAEQALSELLQNLIDCDVSQNAANHFIEQAKSFKSENTTWLDSLNEALINLMSDTNNSSGLNLKTKKPAVILMAGIQGAGKTTTTAKLALELKSKAKLKVLVCSTDIYRPAAMEQLQILLKPHAVEVVIQENSENPVTIAEKAYRKASTQNFDVLIIDTAGRQHDQTELMQEIKQIKQATNPIETILVVDGMAGNFAVESARAFSQAITLTGFILTKMDGDQKGGAAISIVHELGIPVKYLGRGEQLEKLDLFDAARFAKIILDLGDESGLIEQLQKIDTKQQQKIAKDFNQGKWDFNQFLQQLEQIQSMGGATEIISKMPGSNKILGNQGLLDQGEKNLVKIKAMIQSMTPKERSRPLLLENKSRRRRIVAGSASDIRSFNMMLKQFKQMQKMMSSLKGKGMRKLMQQIEQMQNKN